MKKSARKVIVILLVVAAIFGGSFMCYINSNYYHTIQLNEAIMTENTDKVNSIVRCYPNTVNTFPSIMPKWWRTFADYPVTYPLNVACSGNNIEIVQILIDAGADVNNRDIPLSSAKGWQTENSVDIAFLLIAHGADINYIANSGDSVLSSSVLIRVTDTEEKKEKLYRLFDYLLDHCDLEKVDLPSVFVDSGYFGNLHSINKLLTGGYVDVNCIDNNGKTALIKAASGDEKAVIIYLLENGADESIKDDSGKTAYDYAVDNANSEIAAQLKP